METEVFWLKRLRLGKIHLCLGRNDGMLKNVKPKVRFHFHRSDVFHDTLFMGVRVGTRFLDLDWC